MFVACLAFGVPAFAQQMFRCGKAYQDHPCDSDVQTRYSNVSKSFSVNQVNASTDRDCAELAAQWTILWERVQKGETVATIRSEIDSKPISRFEKSEFRHGLAVIQNLSGTHRDVRSALETDCMVYKKLNGLKMESKAANPAPAPAQRPVNAHSRNDDLRNEALARRESAAAARAAAEAARAAAAASRP